MSSSGNSLGTSSGDFFFFFAAFFSILESVVGSGGVLLTTRAVAVFFFDGEDCDEERGEEGMISDCAYFDDFLRFLVWDPSTK